MTTTKTTRTKPHSVLRAADIEAAQMTFSHPWGTTAEITGTMLASRAGLERTGLSLARLAPGKSSFVYHAHHCEEEWIYILSGTATARVDGEDIELGPGDFIAFPTPSVPHDLRNSGDDELVYLMGGERTQFEVADYPDHNKRAVRVGDRMAVYPLDGGEPFPFPDTKDL